MLNTNIIIPARLDSKRLPNKIALNKTGKPLILHTYEQACKLRSSGLVKHVYIVTPNRDCYEFLKNIKHYEDVYCLLLNEKTKCGTHAAILGREYLIKNGTFDSSDSLINLQADYPEAPINLLEEYVRILSRDSSKIVSSYYDMVYDTNQDNVKVVMDVDYNAMYFSRLHIPSKASKKHIHVGIYGFPAVIASDLNRLYNSLNKYPLNREDLEQNFWLENKFDMHMIENGRVVKSINSQEDYNGFVKRYLVNEKHNMLRR